MTARNNLHAIPTTVVTGFLGSGKTTTILNLLAKKPLDERWAVLVNEFGEQGIDGSFIEGLHPEDGGVFVREIPGGCMYCTAHLPMQVGLTQLLSRSKPDRLLIEPTGLGHPREVLATLESERFKDVLELKQIVTLVDPHQCLEERYLENAIFQEQILLADVIFLTKQDLSSEDTIPIVEAKINKLIDSHVPIIKTRDGASSINIFSTPRRIKSAKIDANLQALTDRKLTKNLSGLNIGEDFESISWTFEACQVFDYQRLFVVLSGLSVERIKAIFITDRGVFGYNMVKDSLTVFALDDAIESCIELVSQNLDHALKNDFLKAIIDA